MSCTNKISLSGTCVGCGGGDVCQTGPPCPPGPPCPFGTGDQSMIQIRVIKDQEFVSSEYSPVVFDVLDFNNNTDVFNYNPESPTTLTILQPGFYIIGWQCSFTSSSTTTFNCRVFDGESALPGSVQNLGNIGVQAGGMVFLAKIDKVVDLRVQIAVFSEKLSTVMQNIVFWAALFLSNPKSK